MSDGDGDSNDDTVDPALNAGSADAADRDAGFDAAADAGSATIQDDPGAPQPLAVSSTSRAASRTRAVGNLSNWDYFLWRIYTRRGRLVAHEHNRDIFLSPAERPAPGQKKAGIVFTLPIELRYWFRRRDGATFNNVAGNYDSFTDREALRLVRYKEAPRFSLHDFLELEGQSIDATTYGNLPINLRRKIRALAESLGESPVVQADNIVKDLRHMLDTKARLQGLKGVFNRRVRESIAFLSPASWWDEMGRTDNKNGGFWKAVTSILNPITTAFNRPTTALRENTDFIGGSNIGRVWKIAKDFILKPLLIPGSIISMVVFKIPGFRNKTFRNLLGLGVVAGYSITAGEALNPDKPALASPFRAMPTAYKHAVKYSGLGMLISYFSGKKEAPLPPASEFGVPEAPTTPKTSSPLPGPEEFNIPTTPERPLPGPEEFGSTQRWEQKFASIKPNESYQVKPSGSYTEDVAKIRTSVDNQLQKS